MPIPESLTVITTSLALRCALMPMRPLSWQCQIQPRWLQSNRQASAHDRLANPVCGSASAVNSADDIFIVPVSVLCAVVPAAIASMSLR